MIRRLLFTSTLVGGITLVVIAGFAYFSVGASAGLVVHNPDQEIADLFPGASATAVFRIDNKSSIPIPIFGVSSC